MGTMIGEISGAPLEAFDARHFPTESRLLALESYVKGAPNMKMGGATFQALSDSNENFNFVDRHFGDGFWMANVHTSGYQISSKGQQQHSSDNPDKITVCQIRSGEVTLRSNNQTHNLSAGDIYLHETHKFHTVFGPGELTKILYPSDYFKSLLTDEQDIVVLRADTPINRVANATISSLEEVLTSQPHSDMSQLSNIARELTYNILISNLENVHKSSHELIRKRAQNFILHNLDQPDLDVSSIADHVNASRATLYRAFQSEGGVRESVNNIRLNAARQMLHSNPPIRGLVVNVAFSCGFRSPNQFNRAFKEKFQLTPSEFNQRCFPQC
ncbi:MAG: AraC family transcriptional regulator [Rhizobiaceae bacterium]